MYEYARYGNPTTMALEEKIRYIFLLMSLFTVSLYHEFCKLFHFMLSVLEGAESTLVMASGMYASNVMLLALVPTNGHIVATKDCYKETRIFMENFLTKLGITVRKSQFITFILFPFQLHRLTLCYIYVCVCVCVNVSR